MIDALIAGRIFGTPTERTGKSGKPFALAKIRTTTTEGESAFVSVIAFDAAPVAALLALKEGDSVAVAGPLKVGTWQDKEGQHRPALDIVAAQVLSVYAVRHKRNATQGEGQHHQPQQRRPRGDDAARAFASPDRSGLDDGTMPF
jgi:single-stranded DNA-binding protein